MNHPKPDYYITRALDRYERSRERVLGAMHLSRDIDIAVEQLAENLGGMQRARDWLIEAAVTASERCGR